jgi:ribosomal protein S18 acetylase RimI-like enzyme
VTIEPVVGLPPDALAPLVAESEGEGWEFVRTLADEWATGANRFDRPGERLFAARDGTAIVGVCALGIDPYAGDDAVGRVRRVYVLRAYRGRGVGERLVRVAVAAATGRFRTLHLRAENPVAVRLYERLGFRPVAGANHTHALDLSLAGGSGIDATNSG